MIQLNKILGTRFAAKAKENGTVIAPVCHSYGGDPCDWSSTITIQYCPAKDGKKEFYLYKLVRPDFCDVAYCAGTIPPCPPGMIWNEDMDRCVSKGRLQFHFSYLVISLFLFVISIKPRRGSYRKRPLQGPQAVYSSIRLDFQTTNAVGLNLESHECP